MKIFFLQQIMKMYQEDKSLILNEDETKGIVLWFINHTGSIVNS